MKSGWKQTKKKKPQRLKKKNVYIYIYTEVSNFVFLQQVEWVYSFLLSQILMFIYFQE